MDAGTDAVDILNNRVVPLRRGYIAVKNRSQQAIQTNSSIREGLAGEQKFFATHPRYRNMLAKCGTANLSRTLNQILMHHIRDTLPDIKVTSYFAVFVVYAVLLTDCCYMCAF